MEFKKYLKKIAACDEAIEWVGDRTLQQAWDECNRPDWMLWLYKQNNPDKKTCVKIATYAAKLCVKIYNREYPADKRPEEAIAAAEKWLENPSEDNARVADTAKAAAGAAYASAAAAYADAAKAAADAAVTAADAAATAAYNAATAAATRAAADAAADAAAAATADAAKAATVADVAATVACNAAAAANADVTHAVIRAAACAAACADNTTRRKMANYIRKLIPKISITDNR